MAAIVRFSSNRYGLAELQQRHGTLLGANYPRRWPVVLFSRVRRALRRTMDRGGVPTERARRFWQGAVVKLRHWLQRQPWLRRGGTAMAASWRGAVHWFRALPRRTQVAAGATALGLVAIATLWTVSSQGQPRLMPAIFPTPKIIGFYENAYTGSPSSFPSVQAHYQSINTVLAFWYSITGSGQLKANQPNLADARWIADHGVRMGILVNNVAGSSGSNAGMLTSSATRQKAIGTLAQLVQNDGYRAVNIDFEDLPPSVSSNLTQFMADLRTALPSDIQLSIDVFPPIGVPTSLNSAYNYSALAPYVNYEVIMLYDHHSSGGPAGPISPWSWVTENMHSLLHTYGVPASKLVLAAGVYGYDWPEGQTTAAELPLTSVMALQKEYSASIHLDPTSRNPYFTYTTASGQKHVVWFQNQTTVAQRVTLAKQLHLNGVAIWALGEETPAVWGAIAANL